MRSSIRKIFSLLDFKQKKKIPIVFFMMVVGALLETLSVSLLVPMISIIVDTESIEQNGIYKWMASCFNWNSPHFFVCFFFCLLAAIFVLKNIFLYIQISYQAYFASDVRQEIQNKLYADCIYKPYEFYLSTNTGNILRNIYVDSMGVYNSLTSLLNVVMEGAISIALAITVVIINPFISFVCIAIISVVTLLIFFIIKPRMQVIGKKYSNLSGDINQWILQSTDNIKEIKVMQREVFFINNFKTKSKTYNEASCKNQIISNVPRLLIEATTISGVIIMLGISYINGNDLNKIIPQLSAFAVAAVRLLPSVNRLNTMLNTVVFNEASVDHVIDALSYVSMDKEDILKEQYQKKTELTRLNKGIFIKNVSYRYPDGERNVFSNISLDIRKGQTIGLIGESGAGKTTFVNLILGLLDGVKGDVFWDDTRINDKEKKFYLNIGYIPQQISLLDDSIKANIVFGSNKIDEQRIQESIIQAQLESFIMTLPDGIMTQVGDRGVRLSGGQRQRIGIARALYANPDFLVLDEATSALDTKTEAELMKSINSLKGSKTMIIIAHRLSTLESCDCIYKMEEGQLSVQTYEKVQC